MADLSPPLSPSSSPEQTPFFPWDFNPDNSNSASENASPPIEPYIKFSVDLPSGIHEKKLLSRKVKSESSLPRAPHPKPNSKPQTPPGKKVPSRSRGSHIHSFEFNEKSTIEAIDKQIKENKNLKDIYSLSFDNIHDLTDSHLSQWLPSFSSLRTFKILKCPQVTGKDIPWENWSDTLTTLHLQELPSFSQESFVSIATTCMNVKSLNLSIHFNSTQ